MKNQADTKRRHVSYNAMAVKLKLRRERLVSMFCGSIIMVSTGGGDLEGMKWV